MKLEHIDQRLGLFPEYLKEQLARDRRLMGFVDLRARRIKRTAEQQMKTLNEMGYLFVDGNYYDTTFSHVTFDQWLFNHKHYDLIDYTVFPKDEGLIEWVKNEGAVSRYDGMQYRSWNMWEQEDKDIWRNSDPKNMWGEIYPFFNPPVSKSMYKGWMDDRPFLANEYGMKIHHGS